MGLLMMAMGSFVLVGAITPGPVNVLALRHGVTSGRGVAGAYVLGASVSYAAVVWLMGVGGEFVSGLPWVMHFARWSGAAYLLYLAWRLGSAPVIEMNAQGRATRSAPLASLMQEALTQGALTQVLNPKAWVVALSGVSLFVLSQRDVSQARWLFVAVSLLGCFLGVGSWALVGRVLARWLTLPGRQRIFNVTMASVLALCVITMLG